MASKKIQLYTDRANTIEASPETSASCVILSDGNDLQKVLDNDLTNPTVVHEETSFKVGAGDIDVSSSVVDGEVGRMVIKGKTYQNILPEPSTHVLTNNKEMFKVNEGLDPNVEIVDGVSKSAILSGQTLVNLAPKKIIEYTASSDWDGFNVLVQNSKKPNEHWRTLQDLKPNTKYYISCYVETFEDVNGRDYHFNNSNQNCLFVDFMKVNGVGHYQWISTTRSELTDEIFIALRCQNAYARGAIKIRDIMIIEYQEGMENWEIPYFTGMQSVKLPVLSTMGKNLISMNNFRSYYNAEILFCNTNSITFNAPNDWAGVFVNLSLKPNTEYHISYECQNDNTIKTIIRYLNDDETLTGETYGGENNFSFMTKGNGKVRVSIESNTIQDNIVLKNIQLEEGAVATSYEPHKTNILMVNEDVTLRGIGDVRDELDLLTGEVVQSVGVLNGEETGWQKEPHSQAPTDSSLIAFSIDLIKSPNKNLLSSVLVKSSNVNKPYRWYVAFDSWLIITLPKSEVTNLDEFKAWLKNNEVLYPLTEKSIKTVDLSTSGNWEKVVLDGSETGWNYSYSEWANKVFYLNASYTPNLISHGVGSVDVVCEDIPATHIGWLCQVKGRTGIAAHHYDGYTLQIAIDGIETIEALKQHLSQNPVAVWYQTQTHLDSTQVKQPIFFKDGHIIQSSGADNSLIPTLDYQAKTSNSYVMDLMKANTRYTMKAKSASGTFAIDGTSYNVGTNTAFTSPSSMTNKFLVMSNKTNEEVMILEGDVTSKTIPYFKGIKSAFEDESKIEVLSTGKNLCDSEPEVEGYYVRYQNGVYAQHDSFGVSKPIRVIEGHRYRLINTNKNHAYYDKNMNYVTTPLFSGADTDFYSIAPKNAVYLRVSMMKGLEAVVNTDGTKGEYREPNSTKIPLLSPLRSLPNGVCDELIIDRMKKKATLIQKVGYTELNGDNNEQWGVDIQKNGRSGFVTRKQYNQKVAGGQNAIVAEHLLAIDDTGRKYDLDYTITMGNIPSFPFVITIPSHIINERGDSFTTYDNAISKFKRWLSKAPISVVYQLATPVVTEIDLENFPLVYKDGHIFLNSEIAPVVEIDYNVNQAQLIIGNGETLLRHEQEILDLDKLIVSFVDCEYRLRLLKFDMELSMMSL